MKQITEAEFESEVLGSKEPVLVDFYADTCLPCRMMAPVLREMETEANGSFKAIQGESSLFKVIQGKKFSRRECGPGVN